MPRKGKTSPSYDPSTDRQTLGRLREEFRSIVNTFCDPRPLLRGSVERLARRCGKKACRCLTGQPHQSTVFVDRSGPRRKLRTVGWAESRRLRKLTQPYRALRRLRARLPGLLLQARACGDRLVAWRLGEGRRRAPAEERP